MTAGLAFVGGLVAVAVGTMLAVAGAAVSRLELTRWISQRLRGATVANLLIGRPGNFARMATAIGALGALSAGVGLAALLPRGSVIAAGAGLFLVGVPLMTVVAYAVPRAVGQAWCEPIVRVAAPWVRRLSLVFRPLMPGTRPGDNSDFVEVLQAGSAEDLLEAEEVSIVSGVVSFTGRTVREVMTPRTEIVALPEAALLSGVARVFGESGHSRLPVYRDSLDHIVGMIYAFDLLKVEPADQVPIRPVTYVPGSKPCPELLVQLQRERRQLAVVLDEFGGTAGIVTLERLLEILVGEIVDSRAASENPPQRSTDVVEFAGSAPSREVAARFGVTLSGDAETIGGFLTREAGAIPRPGDRFTLNGVEFDVLAASPTRVDRIAVRRRPVRIVPLSPDDGA